MSQTLYEQDFVRWSEETAAAVRRADWEAVDRVHLAEEIESMAGKEERELESRAIRILEHLLKLELTAGLVHDQNQRLWRISLRNQRREMRSLIRHSPSLESRLTVELRIACYQEAAGDVEDAYGVKAPADCPWNWDQIRGLQG